MGACIARIPDTAKDEEERIIARLVALRQQIGPKVEPVEETPPGTEDEDEDADTPGGGPRWRRWTDWVRGHRSAAALGLVVVLVVLVGGGYGIYRAAATCNGQTLVAGECSGLSDGSVPLLRDEPAQLAALREQIHDENQKVLDSSQPWVSLAYVFPWAASDDPEINDRLPVPALQHELEGALVAQREANHTATFGKGPLVRVLLGNQGRATSQYEAVDDALSDLVGGDPNGAGNSEHIVAVVASGKSVANALKGIDAITGLGLPVLTTRMTSDEIAGNSGGRSVTRIAPNISDGIAALASFVHPLPYGAVLVQSSDGNDNYSRSLGDSFKTDFPGTISASYPYDPRATTQDMSTTIGNICDNPTAQTAADVTVFFAGRSSELNAFIEALPGRLSCSKTHFTVVTASDAIDTANAALSGPESNSLNSGLRANTDLYYAGIASRQAWNPPYAAAGASPPLLATDFPAQFPDADLNDGAAIIGADAVQTVVETVRFQPTSGAAAAPNDTPARVAQVLHERTGRYAISLASGPLSIGPTGKAVNKPVPIIRVVPPAITQPAGPAPIPGPSLVALTSSGK